MKRLHLLGLALMAVLAVSVTASAVASAELAILPTPTAMNPLQFTFKNTGKTTLETVAGKKITCNSVTGSGAAESERLGLVEFKFVGCSTLAGVSKCTGLADTTAGNITFTAEFHLRHLLEMTGVSLIILVGHVHFTCTGVLFLVLGCVASMDILTGQNGESAVEMLRSSVWVEFLQKEGKQKPLEIDQDPSNPETPKKDEVCMLTSKEENRAGEEAGQLGEGTIEKFEQGGVAKTLLIHLK